MAIFILYYKTGQAEVIEHKSVFSFTKENNINSDSIDFYTGPTTATYVFQNSKWVHGENIEVIDAISEIQNKTKKQEEEVQDVE